MKKISLAIMLCCLTPEVTAHTALLSCFDEGDNTITCEGGFSDGSSASGVKFRVEQQGKRVINTTFSELNEVNFAKPQGDYLVILDAGEGHQVKINGQDIN